MDSPDLPASPSGADVVPDAVSDTGIAEPASAVAPCGAKARARLSAPWPNSPSTPVAPRSLAVRNSKSTICAPVRFGNAPASSATAPEITGAEKLVPLNRNAPPFSSMPRTRDPSALRKCVALLPALFEKPASAAFEASSAPAITTRLRASGSLATCAKRSGLTAAAGSSTPSLPAEMTMTTPLAVARPIAARSVLFAGDPPSEMLITRARLATARSTPRAIALSLWVQLSSGPTLAQLPIVSVRATSNCAPKATPCAPISSFAPSKTLDTAVPWPPSSCSPRDPARSAEAERIRPENSALFVSIPLSITAATTPLPVAPAL